MSLESQTQDTKMRRRAAEDQLGKDIINECRVQLMLKFRFLDLALWRMDLMPLRAGQMYPLATDASSVVYDPERVIARFQASYEESVRDYLHLVMHCIFRHPFDVDHDEREAWELACDIVVENAVMDMCGDRFACEGDSARHAAIDEIQMLVGNLLPNNVFGLLKRIVQVPYGQHYRGVGRSKLIEWHELFERDDHGAWPANNKGSANSDTDQKRFEEVDEDDINPEDIEEVVRLQPQDGDESDAGGGGQDDLQDGTALEDMASGDDDESSEDGAAEAEEGHSGEEDQQDRSDQGDSSEPPESSKPDAEEAEKAWEDIAKQIEMNLETFSKDQGDDAGGLMATLSFVNRKKHNYTEFLRQFMVVTEEMQLNMDEFDYIYYTYGMELYGNMPLVEPLEYKETERVHDFVVAIDTSESVSGDLVKRFIGHTFDILKSSEDYSSEVNIHIVQCDSRVQSDTRITDLRDVDEMMEHFTIRGFGGTDFRPAFDYVSMLRKRGELSDLRGLIYFTDGLGFFPDKAPDYDVAFVFMDEGDKKLPPVPPWAMKIVIDEAGLERLDDRI